MLLIGLKWTILDGKIGASARKNGAQHDSNPRPTTILVMESHTLASRPSAPVSYCIDYHINTYVTLKPGRYKREISI